MFPVDGLSPRLKKSERRDTRRSARCLVAWVGWGFWDMRRVQSGAVGWTLKGSECVVAEVAFL